MNQSELELNAARYLWLRKHSNALAPEESGNWGGEELDQLVDACIALGIDNWGTEDRLYYDRPGQES